MRSDAQRGSARQTPEQTFSKVREVCQSLHKVTKAAEHWGRQSTQDYKKTILPCRLNPLQLLCTCKGFRHHCICSHVLAVSHLLKGINLKQELQGLSKRREAGRPRDARGARQIQPDDGVARGDKGEAGEQDCEMD